MGNSSPNISDSKVKPGRLIVLSAPSGAGKTTLCDLILKDFANVKLSISATTRPRRSKEVDGKNYFFLTKEAFEKKIDAGEFVETAQVHGNWYGTPKGPLEESLQKGIHVLFDIDVQGARSLQKHYGDRVLLIFIHPPDMEALRKRLRERKQDSSETIETRLENAYNELEWSRIFQYQITNDDLTQAHKKLRAIIEKECL